MDVISTVAAVISLCSILVQCIGEFVSHTGANEIVNALRQDLQELFRELGLLRSALLQDVRLEPQIEAGVIAVIKDSQIELSKLQLILPDVKGSKTWNSIKNQFMLKVQNGDVLHVQQRVVRCQQSIHFYLTLVNA